MWPFALFIALVGATCDYSLKGQNSTCINPKANSSASFSWPFFPAGAKFHYAVDKIDSATARTLGGHHLGNTKNKTIPLVGWWLEYEDVKLNDGGYMYSNMITELVVYFFRANSSVGGGNNGCESLLGKRCVNRIKSTLNDSWYYDNPAVNLNSTILECPRGLFDTGYFPSPRIDNLNEGHEFKSVHKDGRNHPLLANETIYHPYTADDPLLPDRILPSGNSSFTYGEILFDNVTYAEQTRKAAIALIIRHRDWAAEADAYSGITRAERYEGRSYPDEFENDLTMTMVCADLPVSNDKDEDSGDKDGSENGSDDGNEDGGENKDHVHSAAITSSVPMMMLTLIAALII